MPPTAAANATASVNPSQGPCFGATRDEIATAELSVQARVVVNATGPWTDAVRAMDGNGSGRAVRATKGVHIAVPRERLATHGALTLLSPADGRVMFALPSTATTILGTTDTPTGESPETVRASREDVEYLLGTANSFFPSACLTPADVVAHVHAAVAETINQPAMTEYLVNQIIEPAVTSSADFAR